MRRFDFLKFGICVIIALFAANFAFAGGDHGASDSGETHPPTQIGLPDAKAGHEHGGAGHDAQAASIEAHVAITPPGPYAVNEPVDLHFILSDGITGLEIKEFEKTHDEYLHLITVSSDLEEFSHNHPVLQPDGSFIIKGFNFKRNIQYTMFLDAHSSEFGPMLIRSDVQAGDGLDPPPRLVHSRFPEVIGDIILDVKTVPLRPKAEQEVGLVFRLTDVRTGKPIDDVEIYLAAPGHLVVLSGEDLEYIHVHPSVEIPEDPAVRENMRFGPEIEFATSFAKEGDYKGWLQIKRAGKLHTLPFVFNIASSGNFTRGEIAEFSEEVQKTEEARAIIKFFLLSSVLIGMIALLFPRRPKPVVVDSSLPPSSPPETPSA